VSKPRKVYSLDAADQMEEKKEEPIDLNKLSQRELIIVLYRDVKELKDDVKKIAELELKVNTLETKSRVWGALTGFFAALGTIIFERSIR